ncbi:MAG: glutamate-5-semialdehyde dehydrogenase [Spirochaetales bacterium]|nr:glutamate-5-semialdehyde dehydrogenase [Spirochaetales bacterium]
MSGNSSVRTAAEKAKRAALIMQGLDSRTKDRALEAIREALEKNKTQIFAANQADLERAQKENLALPLAKRLVFNEAKLAETTEGLRSLTSLPDPVGRTLSAVELDSGLELYKVACPIGVLGIIFESRPDALIQIGSLALKSGNAVLLKGGREAKETNEILARLIYDTSLASGFPEGWLQLLESREDVAAMLELDGLVDLIIPRGSNEFVRYIMDHTSIPVLGHAEGVCHLYAAGDADTAMAVRLAVDSKCQYVAVCNAMETLLVHSAAAQAFLPELKKAMNEKGVELRGCEKTGQIIDCARAAEADWRAEYLDLILAVKVVESDEEAVSHINAYGSHHTDAIVTADRKRAEYFLTYVDSADVFWNTSTRFSDGFVFGLGAEVGISTNKIHARGPVGMEGLLIYKWKLLGSGQAIADYKGAGARKFTHKKLDKPYPAQ